MIEDVPSPDAVPGTRRRIRPQVNAWPFFTVLGFVLFFGLGLGAGFLLWGRPLITANSELTALKAQLQSLQTSLQAGADQSSQAAAGEPAPSAADSGIKQVKRYPVPDDGDPSYGPADAPITIIEFSDFQCPYCQKWHNEVWQQLKAEFPTQIRLVYRDFPLYSIHPDAAPAANAAECANEQDKYWEFHDLLFTGAEGLGEAAYRSYAAAIDLDMASFQQCLDENRYEAEVTADFEYASGIGIQSTPTFFVNGVALIGAQPYEVFKEVIELELAGKLSP